MGDGGTMRPEMSDTLEDRAAAARELNRYAEHTRDVLIPELERLAVPWHYFAWRKLRKEIERRNDYVRAELSRVSRPPRPGTA